MTPHTLLQMSVQHRVRFHVIQTVLTEKDLAQLPYVVGVGRLVPGLDLEVAELNELVVSVEQLESGLLLCLGLLLGGRHDKHVPEETEVELRDLEVVDGAHRLRGLVQAGERVDQGVRLEQGVGEIGGRDVRRDRLDDERGGQVLDVAHESRVDELVEECGAHRIGGAAVGGR